MPADPLTVWSNTRLPEPAIAELVAGLGDHRLLTSASATDSILSTGRADPLLAQADVAFGQPDAAQVVGLPSLRWVHLSSAGYTRYDRPDVREALNARHAFLTNSSSVYADPCAEHVLAMLMAFARQLPAGWRNQQTTRAWPSDDLRASCRLLEGQHVLLLGYGAIGRRLAELLQPLRAKVTALRRRPSETGESVRVLPVSVLDELLPTADHVVNILPANSHTEHFFDANLFRRMPPSAFFYNIGRGATVEQNALIELLRSGRLAGAYLDVTDPEPLPPDHPLWTAPNCFITPHTGGGHGSEFIRLVRHFLANLRRFEQNQPLLDRVV